MSMQPKLLLRLGRTCFWTPSVMSTWLRMQLTHMLAGFGWMGRPHRQHNLRDRWCRTQR